MELSNAQTEQIVRDLVEYILEQGGMIGSEKLQPFYAKYPTYRPLVKNMRSFCEQHPDRILLTAGEGPHYSLKIPVLKDQNVAGLLRSFIQQHNGDVALSDLADFSFQRPACSNAILSGGHMVNFFKMNKCCLRQYCNSLNFSSEITPWRGRNLIQFLRQNQSLFTLIEDKAGIPVKVQVSKN